MQFNTEYQKFLRDLDNVKSKSIYARVTALTFAELPIETIEGRITQGSINIDGNSAVRRTCSLTLVANELNYNDYYWGLNTKFKLEIGVSNDINPTYPKIIWFKQGIYLISSFSTSHATNSYTINLQGKDKMCQLNGEVGGALTSSVDFGTIEEPDAFGNTIIKKLPIKDIIRNMVHLYAGEPMHNIIINDLEDYGLELLEYRYDIPLYLYREKDKVTYTNALLEDKRTCYANGIETTLNQLTNEQLETLVETTVGTTSNPAVITFPGDSTQWHMAKVSAGQTAGYRPTDLVYAGDLLGNVGDTITSILDKIKNMLGQFEYFYNIDGRFVFQKKQSLINTMWSPADAEAKDQTYENSLAAQSTRQYVFTESNLITSFNNNPNLLNLRNDYAIWGTRTTAQGAEIPVHMRYAIDQKPTYYKAFDGKIYTTDEETFKQILADAKQTIKNDYYNRLNSFKRQYGTPAELIAPTRLENFSWTPGWWDIRDWCEYYTLLTNTIPAYSMKWYSRNDEQGCVSIKTIPGYENYSPQDCWLIIKSPRTGKYNVQHGSGKYPGVGRLCTLHESYYQAGGGYITTEVVDENGKSIKQHFNSPYSGCTDSHTYIEFLENDVKTQGNAVYFYNPQFPSYNSIDDLIADQLEKEYQDYLNSGKLNFVDWREIIYQMALDFYLHNQENDFTLAVADNNKLIYPTGQTGYEQYYQDMQGFWRELYDPKATDGNGFYLSGARQFWNKKVYEQPELLNFWFDFLDTEGELQQFSVKNIGARTKSVNDKNIKSIYFRETPNILFVKEMVDAKYEAGGYRYVQYNDDSMFSISSQGQSAKNKLDELLYQHGYCVESASISCVPIYYLEPNTRIYIHDDRTKLDGDYIITQISIPLSHNGVMQLTTTKAAETII